MSETFDLLHPKVKKLATDRFTSATSIQKKAIPTILSGKNTLVISGTGMGKTESVMLPLLSKLASEDHKPIALLYLTPLKALNRDMLDRLVWWSNKLDLEIGVRHGDTTPAQRKVQVEYPPHILISTPEQIQSMLSGKHLRRILSNVKYIVIDEVHELADSKRGIQLTLGLERLKQLCGSPQIISLSATVGSPKEVANFFKCDKIIDVVSEKKFSIKVKSPFPTKEDSLLAEKIFVGDSVAARIRVMHDLIKNHTSTLTFTNTRTESEILSSRFRKLDPNLKQDIHHSSLSKRVREKTEKDFKSRELKSIICTSSLQLGIDIGSINMVIQNQSPREVTQAIQRFGRSGHSISKISKGVIIASEGDDLFESAVIARKVLSNELEPLHFHTKSLDVLSHQIIGIANDEYKITLKKMFSIIKNAYPYRNLSWKEFLQVLDTMKKIRLIWMRKGESIERNFPGEEILEINEKTVPKKEAEKFTLTRGRKAITYYFENLSTIPDNRNYFIIDATSHKSIGQLDENFVAEHSDAGSTFIVKGMPWKVISLEGDKLFVEPSSSIESAVPAWKGEMIPVPFEIAQEVGRLRKKIYNITSESNEQAKEQSIKNIKEKYPIDNTILKKMKMIFKAQGKKPFADDKTIVLERYADYVIVNACFGARVNETLANYISAIISASTGAVVLCKTDPYRMVFQKTNFSEIKSVLEDSKPEDVEIVLETSLRRSSLFKNRFLKVAKRFGILRKGADLRKMDPRRLMNVYFGTPVHEESLKEVFTEKLDLEKSKEIISLIKGKKIKIIESKISPIGEYGLRYELKDISRPDRPEKEILRVFKTRLMSTKQRLVCVNCSIWDQTYFVKDLPAIPRCPKCSSRLIGVAHPHATESKSIIKKWMDGKPLTIEQRKKLSVLKATSDVLITYGRKGAFTLAGRGVGPVAAKRILRKFNDTEDRLMKEILKEERAWLANKKYWT
jgi:ATP-dependent helicase Lhr and Lhr-like helicase